MRTSHLAEKCRTDIGHRSPRLTFVALLLSLIATQGCAAANGIAASQTHSQLPPESRNELKITASLGTATDGKSYSGTLSVTGGKRPYSFSVISGALPSGLALHQETGAISGTPNKPETSNFTVRVYTADKAYHADLGLRLSVAAKQSSLTVTVTPTSATVASGGNQQLSAVVSGGTTTTTTTDVRWSASAGTVSTSGLFTAPTTTVATTATVTATSAVDPTASASAAISVTPSASTNLSVSTTNLPDGTQGASYLDSLAATGGTLPYHWSLASGTLPQGVSLDSATGNLSGKPSQLGSFSFTAKVADSASHSATAALALTVLTQSNGKFDGPAELPRIYMLSALANTPANGKTWQVSDSNSLQSALTASSCGDTIKLQAGATFSGVFAFPGKACDDQHWIIVRTSAPDSSLPAEGTRITPCYAGVSSLPARPAFNCLSTQNVMAKLVMGQNAGSGPVVFTAGANHYRLIGLEITRAANGTYVGNLAFPTTHATANHLVFDRVWMHGTVHDDTGRGIFLSGLSYVALVDSYLNDFHCESKTGSCTDAQTVAGGLGSNQDSVYKINNNFLEAAGENIIFGGGPATLTPTDIEVRHNHFFKPLTWMPGRTGMVGGNHGNAFIVKNHFELKNAQRVLFEGNLTENTWGGFSQAGFTLLLTPKNQSTPHGYVCPLCQVTDVTVRYSKFSHSGSGFQLANAEADGGGGLPLAGERYSIHDVILEDVNATTYNGQGQLAQVSSAAGGPEVTDLQMAHITAFPSSILFVFGNQTSSPKMPNFVFANSIVTTGRSPIWSTGGGPGNCAYGNVPNNTLNGCFTGYTFGSNALIAVPSNYPPSSWPHGNTFLQNANSAGFVNFNNGNGGDYHLQSNSVCKNAGSDGKDLGADVNAVDGATAGAY